MIKKSVVCCALLSFFVISLLISVPGAGAAEEGKFSIRLWGEAAPFLSGEAGTGEGAPEYSDAFDAGWGGGGEFAWRFCRWFSGVAGIGYEVYEGKTYQGISFDDLKIIPVYIGGKFHLIPHAASWDLYLRLDAGAASLSSVDVSNGSLHGPYWESAWVFLMDMGAGVEHRWGAWGASLDFKARYLGSPDASLGNPSEADDFWTFPVVFGINYHF